MTYNKKTNLVIWETDDYDQFEFWESNRKVGRNKDLEESILKNNKLKFNPIQVDDDKYVVDGQHRLDICRKHSLPVYYVVDEHAEESDIKTLQSARNWHQKDFMHHYAVLGSKTYQFMKDMLSKHYISVTTFIRAFANTNGKESVSKLFRDGDMKLKISRDKIEKILFDFDNLRSTCKVFLNTTKFNRDFEVSLINILMMDNCDVNTFINSINNHPDGLLKAYSFNKIQNIKHTLINEVYNRGKRRQDVKLEYAAPAPF